jgi:hypothetical protein
MHSLETIQSRRALLKTALVMASGAVVSACASRTIETAMAPAPLPAPKAVPIPRAPELAAARVPGVPAGIRPELFKKALSALNRHSMRIPSHDRIAIADFATSSNNPRFHVVNLGSGQVEHFLVAHGIGSDPEHTGLLQRFSNEVNSEATCEGAFLTADYYIGKHGDSQRLLGLDPTNNNALDRAIVVHSAWYANADMIGRMIYSAKV